MDLLLQRLHICLEYTGQSDIEDVKDRTEIDDVLTTVKRDLLEVSMNRAILWQKEDQFNNKVLYLCKRELAEQAKMCPTAADVL